jgi:preprotein translocase subunit SecE
MADKIKLAFAFLLVASGIAGYYLLADQAAVLRIVSVLAGVAAAVAVAWFTVPGKQFHAFSQESIAEARKVVWPTRKESLQMTAIVFAFVVVMAIILWIVDAGLLFMVQKIMGSGA